MFIPAFAKNTSSRPYFSSASPTTFSIELSSEASNCRACMSTLGYSDSSCGAAVPQCRTSHPGSISSRIQASSRSEASDTGARRAKRVVVERVKRRGWMTETASMGRVQGSRAPADSRGLAILGRRPRVPLKPAPTCRRQPSREASTSGYKVFPDRSGDSYVPSQQRLRRDLVSEVWLCGDGDDDDNNNNRERATRKAFVASQPVRVELARNMKLLSPGSLRTPTGLERYCLDSVA
ncbi:hypothetical protein BJ546DRAFT_153143 [Cryomyces antarcticus]